MLVMKLYKKSLNISTATTTNASILNKELGHILTSTLPKYIKASSTKEFNHKLSFSRVWALNNCKWLEFNKFTVNYLIIDIDDNRFNTISSLSFYVQCLQLPTPTWILKTDKGYHVGYRLSVPFPTKFKSKAYKKALAVKEALIHILEADIHAKSIKGIYRNPLMHEHIFNSVDYELDELDMRENFARPNFVYKKPALDTAKIASTNKDLARVILSGKKFTLDGGLRNSTLFYYGLLAMKKGLDIDKELERVNDVYCYPILDHKELGRITESVESYRNRNKVALYDKPYKEWSKEEQAQYMRNYRAKHQTKTEGEIEMSRSEAGKKAHTKLAQDTKAKVQKAIAGLEFLQEKVNIANVARDAKVSRNTAKKYLIELGFIK